MKYWLYGKRYISTNELASIFTQDYKMKVTQGDIQRLCHHYHIPNIKKDGITFFGEANVWAMRTRKEDFMEVLHNIATFGTARGFERKKVEPSWEDEEPIIYKSDEEDMEYCDNELKNKYQFECKKVIKITEEQKRRIFKENIRHKRFTIDVSKSTLNEAYKKQGLQLNYRLFSQQFRDSAKMADKWDAIRYDTQLWNAQKNGQDGSTIHPPRTFFSPHVYLSYLLSHPKLITLPPTYRDSYYFNNIKISYQNRPYNGVLRISNHSMSYEKALEAAVTYDDDKGLINQEGRKIDFMVSIVLPTQYTTQTQNNASENEIRAVYVDEYVTNGNLSDDAIVEMSSEITEFVKTAVYKFGQSKLFGQQPNTFSTDGRNPMEYLNKTLNHLVEPQAPKTRKPYMTKKRAEEIAMEKQQQLNAVNSNSHEIDVLRIKRGLLGILYNGEEMPRESFRVLSRPIGKVENGEDYTVIQGHKYPNEELIGQEVKLPIPIIDGKSYASGKYVFKANGNVEYTFEIIRTEEGKLRLGALVLVNKRYRPML